MAERAELKIVISAIDQASQKLDQISQRTEHMSRRFRMAGTAALGMSMAITGALLKTVQMAAKEEAGIVRLQTAMHNVGIEYDEVRESLEAWIDAEQQKTAIADSEQRDALASLIRITGDLTEAQDLLTLGMDVAVGTGRDLASANTLIMYALSGNWGMLERYIPALKTAATEEEKWTRLRELFAGQAEAYGETLDAQFKLMKHNIGDVAEAIGGLFAPAVSSIVSSIGGFAQKIKEANPLLVKFIGYGGAAGAALLAMGGVVMLTVGYASHLSRALKAIHGLLTTLQVRAHLATGAMWGLHASMLGIVGIIGGVVAGGILLQRSLEEFHVKTWQVQMALGALRGSLGDLSESEEELVVNTMSMALAERGLAEATWADQRAFLASTMTKEAAASTNWTYLASVLGITEAEIEAEEAVDKVNKTLEEQAEAALDAALAKGELAVDVEKVATLEAELASAMEAANWQLAEQKVKALDTARGKGDLATQVDRVALAEARLDEAMKTGNEELIEQAEKALEAAKGKIALGDAAGYAADQEKMLRREIRLTAEEEAHAMKMYGFIPSGRERQIKSAYQASTQREMYQQYLETGELPRDVNLRMAFTARKKYGEIMGAPIEEGYEMWRGIHWSEGFSKFMGEEMLQHFLPHHAWVMAGRPETEVGVSRVIKVDIPVYLDGVEIARVVGQRIADEAGGLLP